MIVEVFRTNVEHPEHAGMLLDEIHAVFPDYLANFDLQDCDKILRVESSSGAVQADQLLALLKRYGFDGEVLSDDKPVDQMFQY